MCSRPSRGPAGQFAPVRARIAAGWRPRGRAGWVPLLRTGRPCPSGVMGGSSGLTSSYHLSFGLATGQGAGLHAKAGFRAGHGHGAARSPTWEGRPMPEPTPRPASARQRSSVARSPVHERMLVAAPRESMDVLGHRHRSRTADLLHPDRHGDALAQAVTVGVDDVADGRAPAEACHRETRAIARGSTLGFIRFAPVASNAPMGSAALQPKMR